MDPYVGVGTGSVAEGTLVGVFLRILDLLFLDDFLALDEASSAVFTGLRILGSGSAAAGTLGIVFYQSSGNLLLGRRSR